MKHTNKKGFTIVELVIVIAVIAILAAVLIPTFSNLIKKANISNDTAIAKNLNTAAIASQADTFAQAIEAAKEAGYLVGHLNAKAEKVFFVWEDDTNQFLLYDLKAEKVLYSNTKVDGAPDDSWFFVVNNTEDKDGVTAALGETVKVQYLIGETAALKEVLAEGGEIYIDESLVLDSDNRVKLDSNKDVNVIVNLGNSTLSTQTTINGAPIYAGTGTLTINGGVINGSGSYQNENGTFQSAISVDNVLNGEDTAGKLILNGVTVICNTNAVGGCSRIDGDIRIDVNKCNFVIENGYGVSMSCGGKGGIATVVDSTIEAANPFFASQGSKIIINGGTYTSNGNVTNEGISNAIFYIQKDSYGAASIEITGGTFTCNGVTQTFEELCEAGEDAWKALCWQNNIAVTIEEGKVTLTAQ